MGVSGQHHALTLGKEPGTHWTGGWVGRRSGLEAEAIEKSSAPTVNQTLVVQSVASHYKL
jgi:hypothetical protein